MSRVIAAIDLVPSPQSDEARSLLGHRWADPQIGHRHKLGGMPQWLQSEDWPECCGSRMTFYAQLDSIGDEVHLADCGLIYVFVCFDCFSTKSLFQCA